MFNECLFHLSYCMCSNVICVYSIAWWLNPKRFLSVLFVFESVFVYHLCFESFSKKLICFVEKLLKKHFCEYVASKVSCTLVAKMRKWIFISSKILHTEFCDSLASPSRETASHKNCPVHLRLFAGNSQVLRE